MLAAATLARKTRRWSLAMLAFSTAAHAACPAPEALLERFIPADCAVCWSTDKAPPDAPFVLDWIVPSARGDNAPLAAAALAEATARAGPAPPDSTLVRRHSLTLPPALRLNVQSGPAWHGYFGLQLRVEAADAPLPEDAVGYLALVEKVAAGEEGTLAERRLVRMLAGPLKLGGQGQSSSHLIALRVPSGGRLERLEAVGWVQEGAGRVLAIERAGAVDCPG